ncbi:MAG: efflux RND transporter periplasmic adaptor subunit [Bryobacter sp.]|nr:efflux RND transporter periplasmic adaptor subunit [Bryobacter sp.]
MRILFVLTFAFLLTNCGKQEETAKNATAKKGGGPVAVRSAVARELVVKRNVESVGTLFPYDETVVSAEIDGKVEELNVDLGDRVKKGQMMVRLGDEEQRYLLAQNEAQLRSSLERLGLRDEKDRVQDIKLTPDVRRAQADLEDAEQRFRRTRELRDQGIGAQADLDAAQTRFNAARAAYDATVNQTRNLIQEVERFKAVVDLQRKKLRDTTVYAPFDASVKERNVAVGQFIRANTPLLTLVKTDPLRLRIDVPERFGPFMRTGLVARVEIEAFEGRTFTGKIWRISPTVDQSKRTFVAEALIENPDTQLKAGSYARARIPTDKTETAILVPTRSVLYILGSNKIYVIKDDTIEARDVKLGERFETDVEILEGVAAGEVVATTNLPRLDTGSKVRIDNTPKGGAKGGEGAALSSKMSE